MPNNEILPIVLSSGEKVSGVLTLPERGAPLRPLGLVLTHGVQGDIDDDLLEAVRLAANERGMPVLRFRFPFREQNQEVPDPIPKLQEVFRAATAKLRERMRLSPRQVVVGGRSLGARVASLMSASGESTAGLLLMAYPLHRPHETEELRDTHLYVINRPMLFVTGTEDDYCRLDLLRNVLRRLGGEIATLEVLEGADHGFHMAGETPAQRRQLMKEVAARVVNWMDRQFPSEDR